MRILNGKQKARHKQTTWYLYTEHVINDNPMLKWSDELAENSPLAINKF